MCIYISKFTNLTNHNLFELIISIRGEVETTFNGTNYLDNL